MAHFASARTALLAGVASLTLAACGAEDIASPGEGNLVVLPPAPAPTPTPTTPTPTPGTPAAGCPTGTVDSGTIQVSTNDTRRNCQISGTIRGALRLQNLAGTIYSLSGKVQVGDDRGPDVNNPVAGAQAGTLTIDAGVTIFGASGADFLVVNRGSQLNVDGSATRPVVMTSRSNVVGSVTGESIGEWGGLVILGRAPIGDCADAGATGGTIACQAPVEGTAGSIYGGANPSDSSGSIRYLQVRYPGFRVDTNNELNGITLAGVGSGTIFEYVQVHNSSDDGIEWFGGRVNQRYLVLTGNDDDSLDMDSGWKGAIQFAIVTQRAGGADKLIEGDSTDKPVDATPRTNLLLSNFTFFTPRATSPIHLRGGMDGTLVNGVVRATGATGQCLDIDTAATVQAANAAIDELGPLRFNSVLLNCATTFVNDTDVDAAAVQSLFNGGTNNSTATASTLTATFVNGSAETAVTPFNPTTLSAFFSNVAYIGAVRDGNDNWWKGWTCGTAADQASCTAINAAG